MNRHVDPRRVRLIRDGAEGRGPVVYWMSRDQRVHDNWSLLFAIDQAVERDRGVEVVFCLAPSFLGAMARQYDFMIKGLKEVEAGLARLRIPFSVFPGLPARTLPPFIAHRRAALIVTDFDPLHVKKLWRQAVANDIAVPLYEVDAHNIVPAWHASQHQEFSARTLRPKLHRLLPDFMKEFPECRPLLHGRSQEPADWDKLWQTLRADPSVSPVSWLSAGEDKAREALNSFVRERLDAYPADRNDPARDGSSHLSPYLHFGQISAQRVALEVEKSRVRRDAKDHFLEELIVRRELSDNFCLYNDRYDSIEGLPRWGQITIDEHRNDPRQIIYSREGLEKAETHDPLWNAGQMEMVKRGKMHGYVRMYWAKKVLEWTRSPEEALDTLIYLNDRYEMDGRDPNGYVGIAWSIGGLHDRPWPERHIFGKIRYMSYNGVRRKINVSAYERLVASIGGEPWKS